MVDYQIFFTISSKTVVSVETERQAQPVFPLSLSVSVSLPAYCPDGATHSFSFCFSFSTDILPRWGNALFPFLFLFLFLYRHAAPMGQRTLSLSLSVSVSLPTYCPDGATHSFSFCFSFLQIPFHPFPLRGGHVLGHQFFFNLFLCILNRVANHFMLDHVVFIHAQLLH
jgi:hypothetical protein